MSASVVFSHPNHEISMLGTIGRSSPSVIFLTDGGSEERIRETQLGLSAYLPPEAVHFLMRPEQSLYEALLRHDTDFYRRLSNEVGAIIERTGSTKIYCDAVEFYNPVHDMTLPVVRAALHGFGDVPVFEVPLIYQKASPPDSFELQRVPPSLEARSVSVDLTREELAKKLSVVHADVYGALFTQLAPLILQALPARAGREQFLKARTELPKPEPDQMLRYDRRGLALKSSGAVSEAIAYQRHYAPMYSALCAV
jgi:hypothetical protein